MKESSTDHIVIRLLGSFEALKGGQKLSLRRKTRALLAYLIVTDTSHSRPTLYQLFCQEANDPARTLRLLLSRIRGHLGSNSLHTTAQTVAFNPTGCRIDYQVFEQAMTSLSAQPTFETIETLVTTLDLYQGEFLAGLTLDDAPEFELWLLSERTRLRQMVEQGLNQVIQQLIAQAEFPSAITYAQRLIQSNPLLEAGHRHLMWLYAQTEQPIAALQQYEHYSELLQETLETTPSAALQALRADIVAGRLDTGYLSGQLVSGSSQPVIHALSRLTPPGRAVIEAVAILHLPATLSEIRQISHYEEEVVISALEMGLSLGLLQLQADSHPLLYQVASEPTRTAILARISPVRQEALHRQAALKLEQAGARAALLAYHWGKAGDGQKERHCAILAAEEAVTRHAYDEARPHFERALALKPLPPQRLTLLLQLAQLQETIGAAVEAETIFLQAHSLAAALGDTPAEAQAQVALSRLMRHKGAYQEAIEWLKKAEHSFEVLDDSQGLSQTYGNLGAVYWSTLAYDQARSCFEQQLALARKIGDSLTVCLALGSIGVVYAETGAYLEAIPYYEQRLQLALALDNPLEVNKVVSAFGWVYAQVGDFESALACYLQQLQQGLVLEQRLHVAVAVGNMGELFFSHDHLETAQSLYERAITLTQRLNLPIYLCENLYYYARIKVRQQRLTDAYELNAEALNMSQAIERSDIIILAHILAIQLACRLAETDTETAVTHLESLLADWPDIHEQAAIFYAIWQLAPAQETARHQAAELYQLAYSQSPNHTYRRRHQALTGQPLPPPPQLPPLPAGITTKVTLDDLIPKLDQFIAIL